jgi:hypothetical protein
MDQRIQLKGSVMPAPVRGPGHASGQGPARVGAAGIREAIQRPRPMEHPDRGASGRCTEPNIEAGIAPSAAPRSERQPGKIDQTPKWQLDDVSLAALLRALGEDVEQASRRYASLRERLSRYFEWNRVDNADELADETLDRLARRIGRTEAASEEAVERPEYFAVGIARLVLYEQRRRQMRAEELLQRVRQESETDRVERRAQEQRHAEERAALLEKGMEEMSQEQQELIRRYYSVEGRTMIDARKRLAEEMGISVNALRNRALRIRAELEEHLRSNLESHD